MYVRSDTHAHTYTYIAQRRTLKIIYTCSREAGARVFLLYYYSILCFYIIISSILILRDVGFGVAFVSWCGRVYAISLERGSPSFFIFVSAVFVALVRYV